MSSTATATTAPPAPPVRAPRRHYAGLDGLRGIAVIAVMIYHLFPGVLPGGFVGVDIFFVISGFLITSLLIAEREHTGGIAFGSFWRRRVRRLVPALVALVLVCTTAARFVGGDVLVSIGRQVLGAATFSNNWLDIAAGSSYFSQDAPELFRNLWSLAVEEQYYLVWPVLLFAMLVLLPERMRIGLVAAAAAASGILMGVLFVPGHDATRVYFGTDTHAFGLLLGATLALALPMASRLGPIARARVRTVWLPPLGLGALTVILVGTWWLHDDATATYRGGLVVLSLLTAFVILAAVVDGSRLGRTLDIAPLRAIGVRSYGLYLWHWPLFLLVDAIAPADFAGAGRVYAVGGITVGITVMLAWASYRWLEQPFRHYGVRGAVRRIVAASRRGHARRPVMLTALIVAAAAVVGTGTAIVTAPPTTAAQAFVQRGEQALQHHRATATAPNASPAPTHPAPPSATPSAAPLPTGAEITAIGDSVMLASAPELQSAFPGIDIDAKVSRSMYAAPGILQSLEAAGRLRHVVVIGLGTNGPIETATLDQIAQIVGPDRELVLINAQAPRDWIPGVNTTLAHFADKHWRTTALADWKDAIAGHFDLLAPDEIHPGSAGGKIYVAALTSALKKLASVPPVKHLDLSGPGPSPV